MAFAICVPCTCNLLPHKISLSPSVAPFKKTHLLQIIPNHQNFWYLHIFIFRKQNSKQIQIYVQCKYTYISVYKFMSFKVTHNFLSCFNYITCSVTIPMLGVYLTVMGHRFNTWILCKIYQVFLKNSYSQSLKATDKIKVKLLKFLNLVGGMDPNIMAVSVLNNSD